MKGFDDSRLEEGIQLFNAGEFFACHDVLEDLWTDTVCPERSFLQGMIQLAVALHHFEEGNLGGAMRLYRSSCVTLQEYEPVFSGVAVARLLNDVQRCFSELDQPHADYPFHVRLQQQLVPLIHAPQRSGTDDL